MSPVRAVSSCSLACLLVLAGCSSGGDSDATVPPVTSVTSATSVTSETPVTTVAAPATDPSTSLAEPPTTAPSTVPVTQTLAPATSPATATTTTEPLAVQELLLTGEGLGSAVFGADPDSVIEYVTSILGSPTDDTNWVDPFAFAACDGSEARRVDWGVLSLLFTDLSEFANGRRHFMGYEYGRVGQVGDEPAGLRTPGGVTLGSRVVDVLAEFPDAAVNPGDPGVGFPDSFYVSNVFYGLLTGTTTDDYVTVLFGGYGCGE
jgi:hypothetical protein